MEPLCRYIRVPCTLLRVLLAALLVVAASFYSGNGAVRSLIFGLATLVLLQVGHFLLVIALIVWQRDKRD